MLYFNYLSSILYEILKILIKDKIILKSESKKMNFSIENSSNPMHGDVSTNFALVFSSQSKLTAMNLAEKVKFYLVEKKYFVKVEVAKPGFLNFFLSKEFWHNQLKLILSDSYTKVLPKKKKINVEFVSANPTGLMHIGHARGAVLGDTIVSLLKECGHEVTKEYYINDAGNQIDLLIQTIFFHINNLKLSQPIPIKENLYPGEYLIDISKQIEEKLLNSNINSSTTKYNFVRKLSLNLILKDIKIDLKRLGVKHDVFVSERKISTKKKVSETIKNLKVNDLVYYGIQEKPKSINSRNWISKKQLIFKSTNFKDDLDRTLIKADGQLTYFMSDIIYHEKKIKAKYDELINVWGIDHSGYVSRLTNAINSLFKKDVKFKVKLTALVNLIKNKKILKMSKRKGIYITLREVINEVGKDALRFMMISKSSDKVIDFDFDLIKEKTKENPVFYVQYAFARCCSIKKIARKKGFLKKNILVDYSLLTLDEEINLIKFLAYYEKNLLIAAQSLEPQKLTNYLYELSKLFHSYWALGNVDRNKRVIIEENLNLSLSRLFLIDAIKKILKKGLAILDIKAPVSM